MALRITRASFLGVDPGDEERRAVAEDVVVAGTTCACRRETVPLSCDTQCCWVL